jgi:hypothetical protein
MSHKAFIFKWSDFQNELSPLLATALTENRVESLLAFGDLHLAMLRSPHTGFPLNLDWRNSFEAGDVQEIADFVLTKYYDPNEDGGIGRAWLDLEEGFPDAIRIAVLGKPFGVQGNYFDPGKMGSYFQDETTVRESLVAVRSADRGPALSTFVETLERSAALGQGLYVTF